MPSSSVGPWRFQAFKGGPWGRRGREEKGGRGGTGEEGGFGVVDILPFGRGGVGREESLEGKELQKWSTGWNMPVRKVRTLLL